MDRRLNKDLTPFTDDALERELQARRAIREEARLKTAKCCYCYKSMLDREPCPVNPFSGEHVG